MTWYYLLPLLDAYRKIMASTGLNPRKYIELALDYIDKGDEVPALFLQLPTGYGKTMVSLAATYASVEGNDVVGDRVIHVLPLRSIVQDISLRAILDLQKVSLPSNYVSAQAMSSPGSPFFANRLVVTTLDTFSLNLFKLPAVEVRKVFRSGTAHFELPRGFIYSGTVIFDEAHLFALASSTKPLTVLLASMEQLLSSGVPVILMTATLPKIIQKLFEIKLQNINVKSVFYNYERGVDSSFEAAEGKREITTFLIQQNEMTNLIHNLVKEGGRKILVVLNEVDRAVLLATSPEFLSFDACLLHGGLVEKEKSSIISRILEGKHKLVISTQVVEAGVDFRDFNTLITDLAPMDRLVQRVGRLARKGGKGEAFIVIRDEDLRDKRVYDPDLLRNTKSVIEKYGQKIDWTFQAQEIVDASYSTISTDDIIDNGLRNALSDIDENIALGARDTRELMIRFGSLVRDTALVKAYAKCYVSDDGYVDEDGFTGVDAYEARRILAKTKYVVQRRRIKQLPDDKGYLLYCDLNVFPLLLEKEGYDGILMDDYTPWIGRKNGDL